MRIATNNAVAMAPSNYDFSDFYRRLYERLLAMPFYLDNIRVYTAELRLFITVVNIGCTAIAAFASGYN